MFDSDNNNKENPLHLNHWFAMNKNLRFYKVMAIGNLMLSLILVFYVAINEFKAPLVIDNSEGRKVFYQTKYKEIEITDDDIKSFIERFLYQRYQWEKFSIKDTITNISSFSTSSFINILEKNLIKVVDKEMSNVNANEANKNEKGDKNKNAQSFSQKILINTINVTDKGVLAAIDRVVEFNGLKVVSPLQVLINLVKDKPIPSNPLGIFVNGIIEHEE
ncbi:MAG: hypothetical protein HQK51_05585 [Oligoflexia bacterium]|nr:hypothetical protein [Oligoflexia bacterium]